MSISGMELMKIQRRGKGVRAIIFKMVYQMHIGCAKVNEAHYL